VRRRGRRSGRRCGWRVRHRCSFST
jgi:hypothetical protein